MTQHDSVQVWGTVYETLAGRILTGVLPAGSLMDTAAEHKKEFGLAEGTVGRVTRCLTSEGLIEKSGARHSVREGAKLSEEFLAAASVLAGMAIAEQIAPRHAMLAVLRSFRDYDDVEDRWDLEDHGIHADVD